MSPYATLFAYFGLYFLFMLIFFIILCITFVLVILWYNKKHGLSAFDCHEDTPIRRPIINDPGPSRMQSL
ncbi:unnamed protein product [Colias eurytheme]|nr:unnamed protein product [Colias eurytheme]